MGPELDAYESWLSFTKSKEILPQKINKMGLNC